MARRMAARFESRLSAGDHQLHLEVPMSIVYSTSVPALSRRRFLVLSAGAALGAVSAGAAVALVGPGRAGAVAPKEVTAANGAFLDPLTVHEIAVDFDQSAYDAMIETFSS